MFTRARCRKFEPLVTSQIRLRNLIKITGLNLNCDDKNNLLYFTLHLNAFSKPFYTSEKLEYRSKIEWPEINCQQIETSNQKFICVRVWKRNNHRTKIQTDSGYDSSKDEMLFLWGVYFSGLVPVSNGERHQYKDNTLLFHLYGGTFTSIDQIVSRSQSESLSNCDESDEKYSSSPNFSVTNGNGHKSSPEVFAKPFDSISNQKLSLTSIETLDEFKLKLRHIKLEFPKREVQPSYTIEKLLQIQDIQRRINQKNENSRILAERICMKSAACLKLELIISKPVFYEPQKQPGMGRTLSRLLASQEAPPKPEVILKIHDFRMKIECARFKIKLLSQERDRSRHFNKSLELKREKLKDENTEKETMIWNRLRMLSRDGIKNNEEKFAPQREILANVRLALGETKRSLLRELNEIYRISKNAKGFYTINGVHLPDAESYAETTTSTSTEISIALGHAAHAVLIISRILNIPLRNPIKHEGSRTKIIDNIKILPPTDRM